MTGYAAVTRSLPQPFQVELRGVNARFLDLHFRLPDELRSLEAGIRERLRAHMIRGKIECRISLSRDGEQRLDEPDADMLDRLRRNLYALQEALPGLAAPSASALLSLPGLFSRPIDVDSLRSALMEALDEVVPQFQASREAEGRRLRDVLAEKLDAVDAHTEQLIAQAPALLERYQTRLVARLEQAMGMTADSERLPREEVMARVRQEVTAHGLRIDTAEELDRLRSHVTEFRERLNGPSPVGKRLDFLTQELNREANTLASKAAGLEISRVAVELKVLIEQIREQIQNLE